MKLSEFDGLFFDVIKDGDFNTLGNLTSNPGCSYLSFVLNDEIIRRSCNVRDVSCLIVPRDSNMIDRLTEQNIGIAIAASPKYAFHALHNYLIKRNNLDYKNASSEIVIGNDCIIHPTAHIAGHGVLIGNNVVIEENVIIREDVIIGDNCVIMAGAIIGHSACLAGRDLNENLMPLISAGSVKIGHNVQIGSYSVVTKGLFPYEEAEIGDYSLIGYSVDLSHNNKIGKNTIVLDQSQVCGNAIVEDNVHISPQSIISNRLTIGQDADIAIGSVVVNNIKKGMRVAGNYAIENSKFLLWHKKKISTK